MFIDKLKDSDFIEFVKKNALTGDEIGKIKYNFNGVFNFKRSAEKVTFSVPEKITFCTSVKVTEIESATNFEFSDFDFKSDNAVRAIGDIHDADWLKFMKKTISERFGFAAGKAYLEQFKKLREKEKKEYMSKVEKKFDSYSTYYFNQFKDSEGK